MRASHRKALRPEASGRPLALAIGLDHRHEWEADLSDDDVALGADGLLWLRAVPCA